MSELSIFSRACSLHRCRAMFGLHQVGRLVGDMKLADTILLVSLMGNYFSTHFQVQRPL